MERSFSQDPSRSRATKSGIRLELSAKRRTSPYREVAARNECGAMGESEWPTPGDDVWGCRLWEVSRKERVAGGEFTQEAKPRRIGVHRTGACKRVGPLVLL